MLTNNLDKSKVYARYYLLFFNKKCVNSQQYYTQFYNEKWVIKNQTDYLKITISD